MDTPYRDFSQKINSMGYSSYQEYLQSEHWQQFRKKYYRSKKTKKYCIICSTDEVYNFNIELHHKTYTRLGSELLSDVVPVCREHHELIHDIIRDKYRGDVGCTVYVLAFLAPKSRNRAVRRHIPDNAKDRAKRRRRGHLGDDSEE